jgi:predicted ATPase
MCAAISQSLRMDQRIPNYDAADPLQCSVPLNLHRTLHPFGFPVHIKSNDQSVMRAADESWGIFKPNFNVAPMNLRFIVSPSMTRRRLPIPTFRAQGNLLSLVADANNFGSCDLATGFGFACLTQTATAHRDYLRQHFIEAMAYTLLDTQHTLAIHAACVEFEKHGFLLVGDSGAGKSSLAYACSRRGWSYVCDDASSLILHKTGRRVVGNPQTFRLRPSALPFFPEIKGRAKLRNGKLTIEIRTEQLRHMRVSQESTVDYILFLKRPESYSGEARLAPVTRIDTFTRLVKNPWPVELSIHEQRGETLERVLDAPAYELVYGDFDSAIQLLERLARGEKM